MRQAHKLLAITIVLLLGFYTYSHIKEDNPDYGHKVVICIPVYGQSYALGEEAIRITNFDSLRIKFSGRIVTEHLDHAFGYYDPDNRIKQHIKRLIDYNKRSFELSIYGMAESLAQNTGKDTLICIFQEDLACNPLRIL